MKYRTKAAEYYRNLLRAQVDGVVFNDPILSYDEGRMMSASSDGFGQQQMGFGGQANNGNIYHPNNNYIDQDQDDGSWGSMFSKMTCGFKQAFSKAAEVAGNVAGSVAEKIQDSNIGGKMKEAGQYVYEKGSNFATNAIHKSKQISQDPKVQSFTHNTKEGFKNMSENFKSTWNFMVTGQHKKKYQEQKEIDGYYQQLKDDDKEQFINHSHKSGMEQSNLNPGAYIPPPGMGVAQPPSSSSDRNEPIIEQEKKSEYQSPSLIED